MCVALAGTCLAAPSPAGAQLRVDGPAVRHVRLVGGSGATTVLVENHGRRPVRLRLSWRADDGSSAGRLAVPSNPNDPVAVRPPWALTRPIAPQGILRLEVVVQQAAGQAPRDVRGRLRIAHASPAVLRLRGAPPDLSFDPGDLELGANLGCWIVGRVCGSRERVIVRGRDAPAWAAAAHAAGASGLLHDGHGASLRVRFEPPVVVAHHVELPVRVFGFERAGEFKGDLPLDPGGLSGPVLQVTADVRFALPVAIGMVFLGALFGGFFLRRFEIRRQRRLLEIELRSALARYDDERRRSRGTPAGYSLDRWLEPRKGGDEVATVPFPGTRGVSALLWHIRTARDDRDFDEGTRRTHEMIDRIEQWLTLEPVARESSRLLHEDLPPSRGRRTFLETRCCADLAEIRIRATRPPADERSCEQLIQALAEQGQIVAQAKILWSLMEALECREWSTNEGALISEFDLEAIEREFGRRSARSPEQTDALRATLERAEQRLRSMDPDLTARVSERDSVRRTVEIRRELDDRGRNPGIHRSVPDVGEWELRLRSMFHRLALRGLAWTLLRALIASGAYTLTFYSDTWGSVTDFASAFTAGFLTETLLNWAATPTFKSLHVRRRERQPKPGEDGDAPVAEETAPPVPETEEAVA